MQRHVGKLKSRLDLGRLAGKMVRLFRADANVHASLIGQEESTQSKHIQPTLVQVNPDSLRSIRSALLNAERKKAEALVELQKRRFIC